MKAEEVVGIAETAALFLRSLVDEGVPVSSATSLTCSFVTAMVLKGTPAPDRPWEER